MLQWSREQSVGLVLRVDLRSPRPVTSLTMPSWSQPSSCWRTNVTGASEQSRVQLGTVSRQWLWVECALPTGCLEHQRGVALQVALCHLSKWRVTWAPLLYLVQSPVLGAGGGKGQVLTRSLFQPCSLSSAVPSSSVPRVVAVSPQMRLVEDNPSSLSLVEIYKQRCAKKGIEHDNPISRYYDRLATVQARGTQASHQVPGRRPATARGLRPCCACGGMFREGLHFS